MSNNNQYWGKRFGYEHKDGSRALVKRQLSSGRSNSGTNQNSAQSNQSKRDKELFKLNGRPILYFNGNGRRIFA